MARLTLRDWKIGKRSKLHGWKSENAEVNYRAEEVGQSGRKITKTVVPAFSNLSSIYVLAVSA